VSNADLECLVESRRYSSSDSMRSHMSRGDQQYLNECLDHWDSLIENSVGDVERSLDMLDR